MEWALAALWLTTLLTQTHRKHPSTLTCPDPHSALHSEPHHPGAHGVASGAGHHHARSTCPTAGIVPLGSRPVSQDNPGSCRAGNRSQDLNRCGPRWPGWRRKQRTCSSVPAGRCQPSVLHLYNLGDPGVSGVGSALLTEGTQACPVLSWTQDQGSTPASQASEHHV